MAYSQEEKIDIINKVCDSIREGNSVRKTFREYGSLPNQDTFFEWLKLEESFSEQYARACEERAELIFEDILNIADENHSDTKVLQDGTEVTNGEVIQRSRLRVDARKWMLAKMNPKKYGDRVTNDVNLNVEQPFFTN